MASISTVTDTYRDRINDCKGICEDPGRLVSWVAEEKARGEEPPPTGASEQHDLLREIWDSLD